MANDLRAAGLSATESFLKFPTLNPNEKQSEQNSNKIRAMIEKENFRGVLISVVKDYSEAVVTEESGGYYAGSSYGGYGYGGYGYGGYGYSSFYGYYHHPMSYSTYGTYVLSTSTTRISKTYILETLIYNLDEPEDKQLIGLVTSKIVDPSSVTTIAKAYSKAVFLL